ncbi:AlbA family DNA-binding domain-containing protein [Paenarthrobacter nitroguajacolicus]|uniref:AlbA family DNA-binding domain-containing protein n=1 Tax=Paenarthrobacter nitroguajacolicus TaxID=211146 RepID=UPI004053C9BB
MSTLWKPTTEQDIKNGIARGVLRETHYIEVKATARNEQIAQTLASFAIDGGLFIIGIAEETDGRGNKRLTPKPCQLEGELERVDGIARNSIEPPLPVRTTLIPLEEDAASGYVVISVAASPLAPHMASGKYYGRGDASRHSLSDAEVLRHHERRQRQAELGTQLLDEAEDKDYLAPEQRKQGHIYLVAEPLLPVGSTAKAAFLDDENAIKKLLRSGGDKCQNNLTDLFPTPLDAFHIMQRASSISVVTRDATGPGRSLDEDGTESGLLDIELTHSGGMRILLGRGTEQVGYSEEFAVVEGLAVAYTQRLVFWVARLAETYSYQSTWTLGLRMNGIRGLRSYTGATDPRLSRAHGSMERDEYSRVCTVASAEIHESPETVVSSLVGRLLKVLGVTAAYK